MKPFEILQVKIVTTKPVKPKKAARLRKQFTETNAVKLFSAIRETVIGQRKDDDTHVAFSERGVYDMISGKFLAYPTVEPATNWDGFKMTGFSQSYWNTEVSETHVKVLNHYQALRHLMRVCHDFKSADYVDVDCMAHEISQAATSVAFSSMADMEWNAQNFYEVTAGFSTETSHTLEEYRPDYDKGRSYLSQELHHDTVYLLDNIFLEVCWFTWQWQAYNAATIAGRSALIDYVRTQTTYCKGLSPSKRDKKIAKFVDKINHLWDYMDLSDPNNVKLLQDKLTSLGAAKQGGEQ